MNLNLSKKYWLIQSKFSLILIEYYYKQRLIYIILNSYIHLVLISIILSLVFYRQHLHLPSFHSLQFPPLLPHFLVLCHFTTGPKFISIQLILVILFHYLPHQHLLLPNHHPYPDRHQAYLRPILHHHLRLYAVRSHLNCQRLSSLFSRYYFRSFTHFCDH